MKNSTDIIENISSTSISNYNVSANKAAGDPAFAENPTFMDTIAPLADNGKVCPNREPNVFIKTMVLEKIEKIRSGIMAAISHLTSLETISMTNTSDIPSCELSAIEDKLSSIEEELKTIITSSKSSKAILAQINKIEKEIQQILAALVQYSISLVTTEKESNEMSEIKIQLIMITLTLKTLRSSLTDNATEYLPRP